MRCPVCKADNLETPQCRRCKADLSLLFELEERRRHLLDQARQRLVDGRAAEAVDLGFEAEDLQQDEESSRLLAVAHLLNRDYAEAWYWYRQQQERCAGK